MPWHAQLRLDYSVEAGRTVVRHIHSGPQRILQSLYPQGDSECYNVLVRILALVVEPAMDLLRSLRNTWRQFMWAKTPSSPRIWSM